MRAGQSIDAGNAGLTAGMREGVLAKFRNEDIPLIEAQQRFLGDADLMLYDPAILKGEAGSTRARRLLAKQIREEAVKDRPGQESLAA